MKGDNSYTPSIGERVLISCPNWDDENGWVYDEFTVYWMDETFIFFGNDGVWPSLQRREHVHVKFHKGEKLKSVSDLHLEGMIGRKEFLEVSLNSFQKDGKIYHQTKGKIKELENQIQALETLLLNN